MYSIKQHIIAITISGFFLLISLKAMQADPLVPSASELIGSVFELDFGETGEIDGIITIIDDTMLRFVDRRGDGEIVGDYVYEIADENSPPGILTINSVPDSFTFLFEFTSATSGTFQEFVSGPNGSGDFTFIPAPDEPVAPASYQDWAASVFGEGTPLSDTLWDADPSGDGLINLLAYAFGLDPLQSNRSQGPRFKENNTSFEFHFRRNKNASDLTYTVQASTNLQSWTALTGSTSVTLADADGDGNSEWVYLDVTDAAINQGYRFFRLQVTK
jgi:hypothetical protein